MWSLHTSGRGVGTAARWRPWRWPCSRARAARRRPEPRFSFSEAERRRAQAEYRRVGADTLFELVIDDAGKVVKARLVRTHIDETYHGDVLEFARALAFSADDRSGTYRAFSYPLAYWLRHEFEWL